jgi:type IV pilus assembly protein PilQ
MEMRRSHRGRWLLAVAAALACLALGAAAAVGADDGKKSSAPAKTPPAKAAEADKAEAPKPPPAEPAPAPAAPAEPAVVESAATPAGPAAPETVLMGEDGKIESLHAKNEDIANVLELLSRQFQVNIIASKGVKGKVTADLYGVTIDQVLDAICRANALKWSRENNSIYIATAEEAAAIKADESRLVTEVFPLNYLTGDDAVKLIAPGLSPKATTAINTASEKGLPSGSGGSTGANSFGLPDSIIVRDFPENLQRVRDILKRMDRRPRQVLIEATILQVKLDDDTSLGVDFNALSGIDFHQLSTTTASVVDPTALANNVATTAPVPQPGAGPTKPGSWGQVRTEGFAAPGNGLNIGFITSNVSVFVRALEEIEDTTVLSNPKVLAVNKQRSQVIVGDRIPYLTTTTSETTAVQTVNFLDVGTELIFRPFISDDGFVRMEIHPKVSSAVLIGNPLNPMPRETTAEVTCNVMVKDGYTIVIGGLFDETVQTTRSQVPVLGNIPGLGWLFRSNADSTVRREIIVLLTPHIMDDEAAAADIGAQTLDDAKRRCLGQREGFSWITRERIQTWYLNAADKAWQEYEKNHKPGDFSWALWNTQVALNIAPNNLKALRMKDMILSEKRGEPYEPPNWTIWDSIQDRLKAMDEAKQAAADEKAAATPPVAPPPDSPPSPPQPLPPAPGPPAAKPTAAAPAPGANDMPLPPASAKKDAAAAPAPKQ